MERNYGKCPLYTKGKCGYLVSLYRDLNQEEALDYERDVCLRNGRKEDPDSSGSNICSKLQEYNDEDDGK